jgi:GNAT superfamily N-acetyltransferase
MLADDLLNYLGEAFPDNPHWATCFCLHYHVCEADGPWASRTGEQNRAEKEALVRAGRSHGVLAYREGRVVGWCHAAPRASLPRLREWAEDSAHFDPGSGEPVGSIVCFVIAPGVRRQGIATALLEHACLMLADLGMEWAEAYPETTNAAPGGALSSDARSYHGTLAMYERSGFQALYQLDSMTVMRRPLS